MSNRPDETPLRRASVLRDEPSPGTPQVESVPGGRLVVAPASQIQDNRWSRRFKRLLALAQASGFDGYVQELVATLVVNRFQPEDYWPDEQLFFGTAVVAAGGAGNFSRFCIVNPVKSGVLVVVSRIGGVPTAAATLVLGTNDDSLSVTTRLSPRDGRSPTWTTVGGSKSFLHTDNGAAVQFQNGPVQSKPSASATDFREWGSVDDPVAILAPGTSLILTTAAANIGVTGECDIRETPLPQS